MTVMEPIAPSASQSDGGLQRADGSPVRVLVVDDEPSLAELLASVLRYEGWEIRTAADGSSAVRTAPGVSAGRDCPRHHAAGFRRS